MFEVIESVAVRDLQKNDLFVADVLPNCFLMLTELHPARAVAEVMEDEELALTPGEKVFLLPTDWVRRVRVH